MASAGEKKRYRTISNTQSNLDKHFSNLKEQLFQQIKQGKKLSDKELLKLIKPVVKAAEAEYQIPVSIFHNQLSTLESLVTYLVVYKELKFFEIAHLLKRNQRTIWGACNRAKKKRISITVEESEIKIPISVFADRNKAPLYALVCYLKNNFSLNYSQISRLLDLDPRTVWCVYNKSKIK